MVPRLSKRMNCVKKTTFIIFSILCGCFVLLANSTNADNSHIVYQDKTAKSEVFFAPYVTPEEYGAAGDGITDDTEAWQNAINSGKMVVAGSKMYKCGTIVVTEDADINCNNAAFVCTEAVLFSCLGSAEEGTAEKDYLSYGDYSLSDQYTGIVYLVGKNNIFKQRDYYVGGSIEAFHDGKLNTQIPIDITGITAYRLDTIQANIRNISDVFFTTDEVYKVIIQQRYCAFSIIENVNMSHECYSVIQFNECFKCTYRDSRLDIPQYREKGQYYYPIEMLNTCYTTIENVYAHCIGWHCITTGSKTLCRGTKVLNCELYSDYAIPAYGDHPNGIETTIINSTVSSAGLGALGRLVNCDIVCCKDNDRCQVNLDMCSVNGLAHYVIENCRFYPQSRQYSSIRAVCSPRDSGINEEYYFNSLSVVNCRNMNSEVIMAIKQDVSSKVTGETACEVLNVINSNLSIEMDAEELYIVGN